MNSAHAAISSCERDDDAVAPSASASASTSASAPPAAPHVHEIGYDALFRSLARQSRVFPLNSERVTILPSPTAFYEQLLANIRAAKQRITISSLYLGTGALERELVATIAQKLREEPNVQVTIVLDYSRGQRGGQDKSSVSMLKPLIAEFSDNVQLFLYKVPQLKGVKATLPPPFNETMGVSHAKVYLVDDTLVLSGANLSEDYFTNRQDRYVQMADCGGLAEFYHQFVSIVTSHSFQVTLKDDRKGSSSNDIDSVDPMALKYELRGSSHDSGAEKATMKRAFEELVSVQTHPHDSVSADFDPTVDASSTTDAWAFPTLQFTPIDVTHDQVVLTEFIEQLPPNSALRIASGYLNFPPFLDELLTRCNAHLDVILSAPVANGFFNANGIKGALPMAYSLIEQDFYEKTRTRDFTTVLREFNRAQWTFHGKGMWWSPTLEHAPQITIFGSSNFGRRSYGCDLESQVVLYTKNPDLQNRLKHEYDALTQHAEEVTDNVWARPDRMLHGVFNWKYGHWIRPVAKMISAYL
uniref:CDP-diacylglycerol--glycerol-3-phosphate 3-phosphatidyltransferase n=1 Tax=Globisporangium ultimum (strain ATCC 200006 / CBS 805.95 / DAOM BR144) TaxID=431595 RepID=K3X456_GLOUD